MCRPSEVDMSYGVPNVCLCTRVCPQVPARCSLTVAAHMEPMQRMRCVPGAEAMPERMSCIPF